MTVPNRPRILISEPNASTQLTLPYMWAVLKTYWEHHGSTPDAFEWLDPIFERGSIDAELDRLAANPPDIVGLSCYTWNWDLQVAISRRVKQLNPDCLVVAGGPHPDYKSASFFRDYPGIDCVVVKDGEIPFTEILDGVLAGNLDLRRIPGLYLPASTHGELALIDAVSPHHYTGPARQPETFEFSPYLEQNAYYERLLRQLNGQRITLTWETNRGCPYGCSYCDWGSATMSKIRQVSLARIQAEASWIGRMKVNFLFMADANFGIFPRDVGIAELISETRATYDYPRHLYYSPAKNNPERTVEIARQFFQAGLTYYHVLAVQHTDPDVLRESARSNIPASRYREVVRKLSEVGIAAESQMILGIPSDTPEKWKACLAELMEWGVHERYHISPYALLPNAPAADPAFLSKWKIESIERELVPFEGVVRKPGSLNHPERLVVGCTSFTKDDWVEMNVFSALVLAYHNRSLVRLPVFYLHHVYGIPFRELNDSIYDDFCRMSPVTAPLIQRVREVYRELLERPDANDGMDLDDIPDAPLIVNPSRWIFAKTMFRLHDFYRDLTEFLVSRYPQARHLRSAMRFQENVAISPDFDWREGRSFLTDCDWVGFMSDLALQAEPEVFEHPRRVTVTDHEGKRSHVMCFGEGSRAERHTRWALQIVASLHASAFGVFSEVVIERPMAAYMGNTSSFGTGNRHKISTPEMA